MAVNKIYEMTEKDMQVLAESANDPNVFFSHFFKKSDMDRPFQLDYNFVEGKEWQVDMCMMSQSFACIIAGVGSGKTIGTIMSAFFHAVLTRGFKFLNVAQEQKQANLMHSLLMEYVEDTLAEKLIVSSPTRPSPSIKIAYTYGGKTYRSSLQMLTLGEKADAKSLNSWRGDWINIEEAGLVDSLSPIVSDLSGRLNGQTPHGRRFLGRMTLISNPIDNPELWQFFDQAAADPEDCLVMNIDTDANLSVDEDQKKMMRKLIGAEFQESYFTGQRPTGSGNYFSQHSINAGKSEILTQRIREEKVEKNPWFTIFEMPHLGVFYFKVPRKDGRLYYILGDPGIGAAPARNAPVIMAFDVTDAPKYVPLVALWWGNGAGSIMPFVTTLIGWIDYYCPQFAGIDNTATQKNMAELINVEYIEGKGKSITEITGLDFSGGRKFAFLSSLRLSLEAGMFKWPHVVTGIGVQLGNYDPFKDKIAQSKLAQDLVATLSMAAFSIRSQYSFNDDEDTEDQVRNSKLASLRRSGSRSRGEGQRTEHTPGAR